VGKVEQCRTLVEAQEKGEWGEEEEEEEEEERSRRPTQQRL